MFVGVCGLGYSGSGAVLDLLKEYDGVREFGDCKRDEFTLSYVPDGLLDLEYHLIDEPIKHISGSVAISRFIHLMHVYEKSLNRITRGKISKITNDYLSSIIQVEYKRIKPIADCRNGMELSVEKVLRVLGYGLSRLLKKNISLNRKARAYISLRPERFLENTKTFIDELLRSSGLNPSADVIISNQPFPANNPTSVFKFFDNPRAIVVERDPRDIYLTVKKLSFMLGEFIPHDKVEDFIKYYKATRETITLGDNVLLVRFEDLIYKYDETVKSIEEFVGLSRHSRIKSFFDPKLSIRNTRLKSVFPLEMDEIAKIEEELNAYLYSFPSDSEIDSREGIFEMVNW